MGLLTDPRAGNGEMAKFILKWEKPLCYILYILGIGWMMLLASPYINENTYYSENALLPGLVKKESNLMSAAKQFYHELSTERERFPDQMPYAWLLAKFHQLHLDVFTQNFTLNYPFRNQQYKGQNVYGIVRAPRAASTEAIVVSVPYRPITSVHADTTPSVALLLAFAQFCRKQKYWAKDIIFLVTEHEQLGMQSWLDAYHGVTSGHEGVLVSGDLAGRAGSIQAAINLELHSMTISSIDVKVEGLNGQLPNLDLFNLAQNMINKEGIRRTFQRRFDTYEKDKFKKWQYHFNTLMSMTLTQATGIPTGNHGLFHRFGIEAVSLEGFDNYKDGAQRNFYHVGRVVESIVRSLNNLLERFHQSFFFYLLPCTDRYISIALYMTSLVLIVAGLFIKAFSIWLRLQDSSVKSESEKQTGKKQLQSNDNAAEFSVGSIASEILWTHTVGVSLMSSPRFLTSIISQYLDLRTEDAIYFTFLTITMLSILWPILTIRRRSKYSNIALVCVITCVEFATALMCVAMHNFSLALLCAALYVPFVLSINPKERISSGFRKILYVLWPLLHPFFVTSFVILIYTCINYGEEKILAILGRSLRATKQAFVLSIIDSMIYGNWFYNVAVAVMLPIWMLYWNVISRNTEIKT
ncbi:glycosylphosphatidylinositol anchor attachment 1 protein isoform X1 [Nasonia vitripennis]|uniref:GPI-anchor transamidase component GPAA1 n=1 Tax=Nasonia vitripennis TaxID=7425 RepID=A0A7M7QAH2_NASVI|nr:glycosylphosphatidylinositol anchor attachment 1 protein isoform X1 [Nasonia vitripennis]XP_031784450.1 glycosylphosphatidylinositol anchor attachment 1 protein isoform X1 [Nasonia vitripennis]